MNAEVDVDALRRLLAVVEAGSFSAAARALGVSRQAVHRSVEGLEAWAGAALLDRSSHGIRPTPLGRDLLVHAERQRAVDQGVRASVARARQQPAGVLSVTAPPVFAETVLADALAHFVRTWPSISVVARAQSERTDLVRGDSDLMVRVGAEPPSDRFAVLLGRARLVVCAAPAYLAAKGGPSCPQRLGAWDLLEYGARPSGVWAFTRGPETVTVPAPLRLATDAAAIAVGACLGGLGLLKAPELAVYTHLQAGSLRLVLPEWSLPEAPVWAVYGHRAADDPTLAFLIAELRRAFDRLGGAAAARASDGPSAAGASLPEGRAG